MLEPDKFENQRGLCVVCAAQVSIAGDDGSEQGCYLRIAGGFYSDFDQTEFSSFICNPCLHKVIKEGRIKSFRNYVIWSSLSKWWETPWQSMEKYKQ